jgi:hypothetical protein
MKKFVTILLICLISLTVLTGCISTQQDSGYNSDSSELPNEGNLEGESDADGEYPVPPALPEE